ncbi:uncharacterized protein LOC109860410 isoform X2 [Pseudomyrmex gracilis]|uniref:uncharacterized protein LOC109860410 isoform X2 n=1 Tax=Pseudomyrmex gracilis TaxID=219809 RepID=UPI000995CA60|nr:uncharacterized protein LOC109860410 isoform X2 [Pseudomyrmex gracilis]
MAEARRPVRRDEEEDEGAVGGEILPQQNIAEENQPAYDHLEERQNMDLMFNRIAAAHDEAGLLSIRRMDDPAFVDQMFHFLKLCGLSYRDWNLMVGVVFVDMSVEARDKYIKIVYACRYQGFDPSVLLKRLIRFWRESMRQPLVTYQLRYEEAGHKETWDYNNHENLISDITFLVLIFLNRGAVISKIIKKSSRDFTNVLRMLVAKYNIRANEESEKRRRTDDSGPEIITLPRIAACFCQITTELYHRDFGRAIASFTEFRQVPLAIFSPMLALEGNSSQSAI